MFDRWFLAVASLLVLVLWFEGYQAAAVGDEASWTVTVVSGLPTQPVSHLTCVFGEIQEAVVFILNFT